MAALKAREKSSVASKQRDITTLDVRASNGLAIPVGAADSNEPAIEELDEEDDSVSRMTDADKSFLEVADHRLTSLKQNQVQTGPIKIDSDTEMPKTEPENRILTTVRPSKRRRQPDVINSSGKQYNRTSGSGLRPRMIVTTSRLPSELLDGNSALDKSTDSKTLLIREQVLLQAPKSDQDIESDLHLHLPLHHISDQSQSTVERPFPRLNVHVHHHRSSRPTGLNRHGWPEMMQTTTTSKPSPTDVDVAGEGDGDQRWPAWMQQSDKIELSSFNRPYSQPQSELQHHSHHPHSEQQDPLDSQASRSLPPRVRLVHDGLPGFPPPKDFQFLSRSDRNHYQRNESGILSRSDTSRLDNVELAADGAGFVVEPGQENMDKSSLSKYPTEINQYHQSRLFDSNAIHNDQLQAESTGTEWSKPQTMPVTSPVIKAIDKSISSPLQLLPSLSEKLQSRSDSDTAFRPTPESSSLSKPSSNFLLRSPDPISISERVRPRLTENMRSLPMSSKPSALSAGHFPFFIAQKPSSTVSQAFQFQAQSSHPLRSQLLPSSSLLPGLLRSSHFGMPFLVHSKQRKRRNVQLNNPYPTLPSAVRKYRIFSIDSPRLQPLIGHLPPQSSFSSDIATQSSSKLTGIPAASYSSGIRSASIRRSTTESPLNQPEANSQHRMRAGQPLNRGNGKLSVGGYNYAGLTPGYQPPQQPLLGRKPTNSPISDQKVNPPSSAAGDHPVAKNEPEDEDNGSFLNLLNSFNGLGGEFNSRKRPQSNSWKPSQLGSASTETPSTTSKYGILGSGNFEIIRGGFYKDLSESKSGSKLEDKVPQDKPESADQDEDGSVQDGGESEDDGLRPVHTPGNGLGTNAIDPNQFLANDFPLLGFQGFDDFARATNRRPYRTPIGLLI